LYIALDSYIMSNKKAISPMGNIDYILEQL
jgi:hypothetical protein